MTGRIKILILVIIPLFFHGCDDDMCIGCGTIITVRLSSYVTAYSELKKLDIVKVNEGLSIRGANSNIYQYNYRVGETEKYDELCEKHSDLSFNKKYKYGSATGPQAKYPTNYWSVDFVSVEVVSDSDWDAEHPAGTSLGDIAMFYSVSPYPYIKSGYQDTFDWELSGLLEEFKTIFGYAITSNYGPMEIGANLHPVQKMVSDLVPGDLILLGAFDVHDYPFAHIKFTDLPTMDRNHKITVRLTADNGQEFSSSVAMSF